MAKTIAPNRASVKEPARKLVKPRKKASPDAAPAPTAAVEGKNTSGAEEVPEIFNLQPLSRQPFTGRMIEKGPAPFVFVDDEDMAGSADMPEVFNLQPLSTEHVILRVVSDEPARFHFVDDDDFVSDPAGV